MIMENVIPSNQPDLTGRDPLENRGGADPMQPNLSTEEELDPKTKEGFQRLVAKREQEAKAERERAAQVEAELEQLRRERKQQKLQELDETERLKVERDELAAENAKLRMSNYATRELQKRGIKPTDPIYDIVIDSPWSIPFIRRSLGDSPTWAEVVRVVEDKLPAYLDTLVSHRGETIEDDPSSTPPSNPPASSERKSDPERPANSPQKRVWSRREIAKMDDATYLKHQKEIKLAQSEGRIVD